MINRIVMNRVRGSGRHDVEADAWIERSAVLLYAVDCGKACVSHERAGEARACSFFEPMAECWIGDRRLGGGGDC